MVMLWIRWWFLITNTLFTAQERLPWLFQAKLNYRFLKMPPVHNLVLKIKVAASFLAVVGLKKVIKLGCLRKVLRLKMTLWFVGWQLQF